MIYTANEVDVKVFKVFKAVELTPAIVKEHFPVDVLFRIEKVEDIFKFYISSKKQ